MKNWCQLLLLLVLLSCAGEDDPPPVTELSGVIINDSTGRPFDNAEEIILVIWGNCSAFPLGCPVFYNFAINDGGRFSVIMPWGETEVQHDLSGYTVSKVKISDVNGNYLPVEIVACGNFTDCKSFWLGGKFTDLEIRVQQL